MRKLNKQLDLKINLYRVSIIEIFDSLLYHLMFYIVRLIYFELYIHLILKLFYRINVLRTYVKSYVFQSFNEFWILLMRSLIVMTGIRYV